MFFSCSQAELSDTEENTEQKIVVGVFDGDGASVTCVLETMEALKIDSGIAPSVIHASDMVAGKLDAYDAIIFPGGSGSKELNNLGKLAQEAVRSFAKQENKAVIGICAGGYLLSSTPTYPSLAMASAKNIDRAHYARGRGLVEFTLNEKGEELFPELVGQSLFLQYYDGPILAPVDSLQMTYTELGRYKTDIHPNVGIPSGITPGKTFLLIEKYGKGAISIVAGHPEATPGMRWMVPRMVRFSTNNERISYDSKWVKPELNDSAILFDNARKTYEKENFWKLVEGSPEIQMESMSNLYEIRSRPAVRWNIGLLRDSDARVRKHAAFLLKEAEYTWAIADLKAALAVEKNMDTKTQLEETILFLDKK